MPSKSKNEIIATLDDLVSKLKKFNTELKSTSTVQVFRQTHKDEARKLSSTWFNLIKQDLITLGLDQEIIDANSKFEKLLALSSRNSLRTAYITGINNIIIEIEQSLKNSIIKHASNTEQLLSLSNIAENATSDEIEYLTEAINCANSDFYRASVILGWSAAISRIQKVIEKEGFDEFNRKSVEMQRKTKGRYKRFSNSFDIGSRAELQELFDSQILWVLEYWGLIDINENERLSICFTMRNNAAHPGEAKITSENLLSFFSDLKTMVFDKKTFQL